MKHSIEIKGADGNVEIDIGSCTIGVAQPNKRDAKLPDERKTTKLRALKEADATLYAAKYKVERMILAEEKRLEREAQREEEARERKLKRRSK